MNKREEAISIDLRGNHGVRLNPCTGCLNRGFCEGEHYMQPSDYCRYKRTENDIRIEALREQAWKGIS